MPLVSETGLGMWEGKGSARDWFDVCRRGRKLALFSPEHSEVVEVVGAGFALKTSAVSERGR